MNAKIMFIFAAGALLLLNSCMGVSADISIRADGSGKIVLEYKVSQMLESMGRLDGNERWPAIPVGRADFERSAARIPDLRLASYKAGEARGGDLITRAVLEFKTTEALMAFLGGAGESSFSNQGGRRLMRLALLPPPAALDPDLLSLLKGACAGYELRFAFSLPSDAALTVAQDGAHSARRGKKVSFAMGMGELLGLKDGLDLEIAW